MLMHKELLIKTEQKYSDLQNCLLQGVQNEVFHLFKENKPTNTE